MKKICSILLVLSALSFSSQLVRVELGTDRLLPLFDRGLSILAEVETWALLYVADQDVNKLQDRIYTVLERDPVEGFHYLVRVLDPQVDMGEYGTVLTTSGNDVLIRIDDGMLEPLIRNRVAVKRILFTPIQKGGGWSGRFTYDPLVQDIVDMVDPDSVLSYVQRLQDFRSRYSTHDSCFAAANYIADKFIEYGCDSVYYQYHSGGHAPNVIGIKRGIVHPESIYAVVCGHFDATSSMAPTIAPGADDNASGTVSTIEAARVMENFLFEHSIRYIAFSGEEFGLYGSEHYAAQAYSQGDSILGVLNADMIAYANTLPESLEVIGKISNPPCETFADFFIACADSYTTLLTDKHMTSSWIPSDNQSFLDYGYVALCNIEDYGLTNPHYHQPSDTIGAGYNNNDFCTGVIKAQVAALAVMAVPSTSVYLQLVDFWIVDTAPGGNGNGWWEGGEEVDLVVQLYNAGIDTSFNTYAVLNTSDPYTTIINDSVHAGILLPRDTTEVSFRTSAAVSAPSGHLVEFDLVAGTAGDSWDYGFSLYINPLPLITFQYFSITGGNGNGILDPGETADVIVTVRNEGNRDAEEVTATLQCGSPYITIQDDSGYIDFIAMGDTASNAGDPFTVTADGGACYGTDVWCELLIEAGTYVDTLPFMLVIGEFVPSDTGYYYVYYSGGLHEYAPEFEWLEIGPGGPGSLISEITNEDADTVTVGLPFTFTYYGEDYTTVGVCSNGFLEFPLSTYRFGANTAIPAVGGPRGLVAPFWDDLDPSEAGDIYQYYDAASHRWIVEFYQVDHYGGPGHYETFQVILCDPVYYATPTGDGEILMEYLVAMQETGNTVGLENYSETVGVQYHCDGVYDEWAVAVTDSFALRYTTYPPDYTGIAEDGGVVALPRVTRLVGLVPNPFSRRLAMEYQIARVGVVEITVYDAVGRLVQTLVDAVHEPGFYTASWNARDLRGRKVPAGVYFVRFRTEDNKRVEKIVLVH